MSVCVCVVMFVCACVCVYVCACVCGGEMGYRFCCFYFKLLLAYILYVDVCFRMIFNFF